MPISQDRPGEGSSKNWQAGFDLEVETVYLRGKARYRWTLYDRAHMIHNGLTRTPWGAQLAAWVAVWRYSRTL